jgi:hypothetical protein
LPIAVVICKNEIILGNSPIRDKLLSRDLGKERKVPE